MCVYIGRFTICFAYKKYEQCLLIAEEMRCLVPSLQPQQHLKRNRVVVAEQGSSLYNRVFLLVKSMAHSYLWYSMLMSQAP